MIKISRILILLLLIICFTQKSFAQQYTKYVTVTGAGNHDGSSLANAMTLAEARTSVAPGDYVFLQKGDYALSSQSLSFSTSGTAVNPIIWEGEITDADLKVGYAVPMSIPSLTADKINSTVITYSTASNGGISMGGDYNYFRKIVFNQEGGAFNLINVTGDYVQLDSCAVKYPSNASSSSNHTVYVRGGHVTFKHTSFYNGSRCIIWVRDPGASNFLMEQCKLTNATNHPPIQIMPTTNSTDTTTMKRIIIRNNIFYNSSYSDGIYWRHLEQMAFYNNLYIRSSTPYSNDVNTGTMDSTNTKGGIIAYNTIIENTSSNMIYNVAANQVNFVNNIFYTTAVQDVIVRYGNVYTPQLRHNNDYNLIYSTVETYPAGWRYTWNGNTGLGTNYTSATGQGAHEIYSAPTFTSIVNDDYSPLLASSPQVGHGTPITIVNGYWLDITTDFFGNPRDPNNPTIGAIEYSTGVGDIFPPNLLGAVITNATNVILNFSEPLNPATAQNVNNYSINNGIGVISASIVGSVVTLSTSEHSVGPYTVTVNNVTDLAGNVINPNNNTASYNYILPDVTPPDLLNAVINNSTSLTLSFSELLNTSSAQNINNYSINNGISVTAASVSGLEITLTTSAHSSGSYVVTVNNVTDLAGNIINPNNNTASYDYSFIDVTPPQVVNAVMIDSVNLNVYFSENLEPNTAENINNYSIAGISITNATLNANIVTLSTSVHTNGTYSVVVSNVTDLAGNVIDPQQNSAIYEYLSTSDLFMFTVSNVLASVVPEPDHTGDKTHDGLGFDDGDPDSRWAGDTMPEWLVYDLGDVQILNVTKFSFFKWNEGRTYNYSILVSSDSITWTTVRDNALSVTQEWSEEVVGPIEARYIKVIFITSNQNSWAGLWEAQFLGHLKMPTDLDDDKLKPTSFVLEQNYPNPFNPSTMIRVHLAKNTQMRLVIYNMLGEFISELANAEYASGTYDFNFESKDLASGMYLYRVESPDFVESRKMLLIR